MIPAATVTGLAVVVMFGYGPAFALVAWLKGRNPQPAPAAPPVGLTTAEWDELTALQDKARREFDHAADFDMWTKEMTS